MTENRAPTRPPSWVQFLAWAPVGTGATVGPIAAFTPIGLFAILPTAAFALLAVRLGGANLSAVGTAAGAGVWGFVLAGIWWPDGSVVWPALAVGVALAGGAATAFLVGRARVPARR